MSISEINKNVNGQNNASNQLNFNEDGYPINPTTGKPYTRLEIVSDRSLPYPTFVDPANPSQYWRRRTPAELAAEQQRIVKKQKARARRQTHQTNKKTFRASSILSSAALQQTDQANAMAEQLDRINGQDQERPEESHTVAWYIGGYFYKTIQVV